MRSMKNATRIPSLTLVVPLCVVTSCMGSNGSSMEVSQETAARPQQPELLIMDYLEDREVYKMKVIDSLDQNNEKIIALRNRASAMNNTERLKLTGKLDRIERVNNYMRTQIDEYTGDGVESWNQFKEEFGKELRSLNETVDRVSAHKSD